MREEKLNKKILIPLILILLLVPLVAQFFPAKAFTSDAPLTNEQESKLIEKFLQTPSNESVRVNIDEVAPAPKAPSEPLTESTTRITRTINTPSGFFNGVPAPNITVTYGFSRLGAFWYSNPQGNFTAGIMTLKCGAQVIAWPLSTGGKVYYNSTHIAYNLTLMSGCTGNVWLYFKSQVGTLGYPSPNLKVIIIGTLSTSGTLNLLFLGGSLTRTTDLTGRTDYQVRMGTTGLGFDWSDSVSLNPVYDSAAKKLSYSVGTSFNIDPSTVATTSVSNNGVGFAFQRHTCFQSTRFWVAYSDGTNILFRTSTDGTTWSAATTLRASGTAGTTISIACDGTYLYYAFFLSSVDASILFRKYTTNSDGSVTAAAAEQDTAIDPQNGLVSIEVDTAQLAYVCYESSGANQYPTCAKNANSDGTWSTAAGFPKTLLATSGTWSQTAVRLSSGKMVFVFGQTNGVLRFLGFDGASTYKDEVDSSSSSNGGGLNGDTLFSCAGDTTNDVAGCSLTKLTSNDLIFEKYTYSSNTLATEATILASANSKSAAIITIDLTNQDWFATWAGSTANIVSYSHSPTGATWDSATQLADETTPTIPNYELMSGVQYVTSGNLGVVYQRGSADPFDIRYATLTIVTQTVTLTVSPVGATQGTMTLSGSASPATVAGDGAAKTISCVDGRTVTATTPADGSNTRHRFSPISTTWTFTCNVSNDSQTYYSQLQNTYQATPQGQTTWESGLSALSITGTVLGTGSTEVCSITLTSGGGAQTCSGWADYNLAVSFGDITGEAANTRRQSVPPTSFTQTTGGNTNNVDWYLQHSVTASYSLSGGGSPTAPILNANFFGTSNGYVLTTTGTGTWFDASAAYTTTNPTTGSSSTERWVTPTASGTVSAGATIAPTYYHQYLLTNGQSLSVTRTNNGSSAAITGNGFVDSGTSLTVAATYSCSFTLNNASSIAQFTPSGLQLFTDSAASSLADSSGGSSPYVTFTGSNIHVIMCIPNGTELTLNRVLTGGAATTYNFVSPRATWTSTGSSVSIQADFTGGSSPPPSGAQEQQVQQEGPIVSSGGGGFSLPPPVANGTITPPAVTPAAQAPNFLGIGILGIMSILGLSTIIGALRDRGTFREPKVSSIDPFRQPSRKRGKFRSPKK